MDSHSINLNIEKKKKEKLLQIYTTYCQQTTSSLNILTSSQWMLPKEKISKINKIEYYLSLEEMELFKNLESNMIVTGKITKIETENSKTNYIEIRLDKVIARCYKKEEALNEFTDNRTGHENGLSEDLQGFYSNLFKYKISGYIKKNDIYDNKLLHLNDDMDLNLKENNMITCLIIKNKLLDKDLDYRKNIKRNEFLQLSLKNYSIKNTKQYFISDHDRQLNIPFMLGVNYSSCTNNWIDYTNKINRDVCVMNESVLNNLIKENKLKEYGIRLNHDKNYTRLNQENGFSYEKIRKVQNYDWADEYVNKGNDMIEIKNYEKAIEYFTDAEKLDSLNKEIYHQKGFCYIQIKEYDKAKTEFKNCLKIDPDDESAKKSLYNISNQEKERQSDLIYSQMLSKKRYLK